MLLAVRISSYGSTWEVWRALQKLECTLTHLSCSPNFPRASITRYTHAKHEQILNSSLTSQDIEQNVSETLADQGIKEPLSNVLLLF